jgi:hypothetical protein
MIEFLEKRLAELRKDYRDTGLSVYLIRSRECMLILNKLKETEEENARV